MISSCVLNSSKPIESLEVYVMTLGESTMIKPLSLNFPLAEFRRFRNTKGATSSDDRVNVNVCPSGNAENRDT